MVTRERLHELLDALPESEWPEAERLLVKLRRQADPVLRAIQDSPVDDEPETPEEAAAVAQAKAELAAGQYVSHEELLRRLSQ
jgi:hypothetical protein